MGPTTPGQRVGVSSPTASGGKSPERNGSPDVGASGEPPPVRFLPPLSARYQGHRRPRAKYDKYYGKDMPAWSTSIFAACENPRMTLCAMTGLGVCVLHGQVQDSLYSSGCCLSCMISLFTWGECGRQRSFFRKRLEMPGEPVTGRAPGTGWFYGCCQDFLEVLFFFPLTTLQEAREIEIRSMRRWHPVRGFRGIGEDPLVAFCGEETLERTLAAYTPKPKDILREGLYDDDDDVGDSDDESEVTMASPVAMRDELRPPARVDIMTR